METMQAIPVSFTEGATRQIKRLMAEKDYDASKPLRVGVKGGGCSGLSYILGFDEKKKDDSEFEINGIRCVINNTHEIYLHGMEIDWQDGLNNRGFDFKNPNASKTCGCGTSFAV